MSHLHDLLQRFAIPGVVSIEPGDGALTRVSITSPLADAHIYLHGAHVTHFQRRGESPVLFLSRESFFQPGKAIRGGVPVIFPWFGPRAGDSAAPAHGFIRTVAWELADVTEGSDGAVVVTLEIGPSETSRKYLPQDFRLRYIASVGSSLEMTLEVQNTSDSAFTFEEALHTYLVVGDVRSVKIDGFAGREYIDKTDGLKRKTQLPGPVTIVSETDRMYVNATETITVADPTLVRTLTICKENSATTVLWNPWIDKARALPDFGDDEWPGMLCVETANAGENEIHLAAGATHRMKAIL